MSTGKKGNLQGMFLPQQQSLFALNRQCIAGREIYVRWRNTQVLASKVITGKICLQLYPSKIAPINHLEIRKRQRRQLSFLACLYQVAWIRDIHCKTVSKVFSQNLKAGRRERTAYLEEDNASWGQRVSGWQKKVQHLYFGNI